jgi:hypothetical protein
MADIENEPGNDSLLARCFPWFASIAVSLGMGVVTLRMAEASNHGQIDWISYPAFTLLVIFIFAIYGLINRWQH